MLYSKQHINMETYIFFKDLKTLLNESTKGRSILESALKNQKLNSEQRNDLVGIIVDDIIANDIVLYTQDFKRLVEEICTVLPCEQNMKVILRK